jgi:hypothetical protein
MNVCSTLHSIRVEQQEASGWPLTLGCYKLALDRAAVNELYLRWDKARYDYEQWQRQLRHEHDDLRDHLSDDAPP